MILGFGIEMQPDRIPPAWRHAGFGLRARSSGRPLDGEVWQIGAVEGTRFEHRLYAVAPGAVGRLIVRLCRNGDGFAGAIETLVGIGDQPAPADRGSFR